MIKLHCYIDKEEKKAMKFDISQKLPEVRKQISEKLEIDSFSFLDDDGETPIPKSSEDDFELKDILINEKEFHIQRPQENIVEENVVEENVVEENVVKENTVVEENVVKENTVKENTTLETSVDERKKPIPDAEPIEENKGLKIFEYPSQKFDDYDESRALIMLVVGETGSGKTTLLNCLVNYLLGIQFIDDFRYKIIIEDFKHSQAQSMTEEVNIYNIKPINGLPPIKIIDTPGFGDTRGIEQDIKIRNRIEEVFREQLTSINGICFLAKCSDPRLTASQKYIFSSILDLFGNDVAENFVFFLTFCDGSEPEILDALKEEETVSQKILPKIKNENWYYTFNNKSVFNPDRNEMNKMFYESTMKNFKDFCEYLKEIPRKSLTQSKEVIQQRRELEASIGSLKESLKYCLDKMDELNTMEEAVKNIKEGVNKSKNKKIKITVSKPNKVEDGGILTSNVVCEKCKFTCHKGCWNIFRLDAFVSACHVFEAPSKCTICVGECNDYSHKKLFCKICPNSCNADSHKAVTYHYEYEDIIKEATLDQLEEEYCKDKDVEKIKNKNLSDVKNLTQKERILKGLKRKYEEEKRKFFEIQEKITKCANKLTQIALREFCTKRSEEYIDLAIKEEEANQKKGYKERIISLKKLKSCYKTIRKCSGGKIITIEEFKEEVDSDEKNNENTKKNELNEKIPKNNMINENSSFTHNIHNIKQPQNF